MKDIYVIIRYVPGSARLLVATQEAISQSGKSGISKPAGNPNLDITSAFNSCLVPATPPDLNLVSIYLAIAPSTPKLNPPLM